MREGAFSVVASPLGATEQYNWQLIQIQNDRGVGIDRGLLTKTRALAAARLAAIQDELKQATSGALYSLHQIKASQDWLAAQGCMLPNLQATTIGRALKRDDLSTAARQVLLLRNEAAHNLKAEGLQRCCDLDNRIRDTCIYSGAGTGRSASRSPNLQNLQRENGDTLAKVNAVLNGDLAEIAKFGPPLKVLGEIERALICAEPGKQLFIGDWSGQESRGLAYLVGEEWKRDAWENFDNTGKPEDDPYYQLGIKCGMPPEIARAFGKALDLACGYGSGPERVRQQILKTLTLPADTNFERFVQIWRAMHPATASPFNGFWKRLRGWVNYFAVGHSSECFSYIKDWVEKKVRRHMAHARKRKGFGWEQWSRPWLYNTLKLFNSYRVRRDGPKAALA